MDTISSKQIKQARDLFHALLTKKTKEAEWQKLFAEHPYVITPSLPFRLEPKDIVSMGRPGRTEPDLIFYPQSTWPVNFYGVIELKRPDQKISRITRKNVAILSSDAYTAIEQAKQYVQQMPLLISSEIRGSHLFLGNNQYLFIIMGLSENELIFKPGNELYRAMIQNQLPSNLQILPYDILLHNFEQHFYHNINILVPDRPSSGRIVLRSEPLTLSEENVKKMLQYYNFYEKEWNWTGTGIIHHYETIDKAVIVDHTTDLMWLRSGSAEYMTYEKAEQWLDDLNQKDFAGYHDWRLPTLEEAMSLMKPKKNKDDFYIDPNFNKEQNWIWTDDKVEQQTWAVWVVYFGFAYCFYDVFNANAYVRAVRSHSSLMEKVS